MIKQDELLRPQPVGVVVFPVGALLLPRISAATSDHALAAFLSGGIPSELPVEWRFYNAALHEDFQQAADLALQSGTLLGQYNAYVLSADPSLYQSAIAKADGLLRAMLLLAAYAHGVIDDLPESEILPSLDGELLAYALMVQATMHLEQGDVANAKDLLLRAAALTREISPIFSGQLFSQAASLAPVREKLKLLRESARMLDLSRNERQRAEAWITVGQACQEVSSSQPSPDREPLIEATNAYQRALQAGITPEKNRDLFALVQNNLGLAYLAMPMSNDGARLRSAIAIQAFRMALQIYDRESSPEAWVSTQLNLANALQYSHSAHPEENIAKAVEIYEELLEMRPKGIDPVGHARLLANQAHALAHLGIFAPALAKATEAHKILHWHNEPELAQAMLQLTEAINQKLVSAEAASLPTEVLL